MHNIKVSKAVLVHKLNEALLREEDRLAVDFKKSRLEHLRWAESRLKAAREELKNARIKAKEPITAAHKKSSRTEYILKELAVLDMVVDETITLKFNSSILDIIK